MESELVGMKADEDDDEVGYEVVRCELWSLMHAKISRAVELKHENRRHGARPPKGHQSY